MHIVPSPYFSRVGRCVSLRGNWGQVHNYSDAILEPEVSIEVILGVISGPEVSTEVILVPEVSTEVILVPEVSTEVILVPEVSLEIHS